MDTTAETLWLNQHDGDKSEKISVNHKVVCEVYKRHETLMEIWYQFLFI